MRRKTILLTGATGAVGRDVLRRFAARRDLRINALVRASAESPEDRVKTLLGAMDVLADLRAIRGDILAGSTLGVPADDLSRIRRDTTHVIHAAGSTSFTLPLGDARSANVAGAQNVLAFVRGCASLECAAFLSTVYVSGKRRGVFAESDSGDAGYGFVNTYEQSKAEMERVVAAAMADLPLMLIRLSTVLGDSVTGEVAGFNAVHHAIRLLYNGLAPMIPGGAGDPVDVVSSDFASAATVHLTEHAEAGNVYHVAAGAASDTLADVLGETVRALSEFRPLWRKRAVERPLIVPLDTYELFVRSVDDTGSEVLRGATRSIRSFAYQLASPKTFGTARAADALSQAGIQPTRSLDFLPRIVKYCLDTNWGAARC